jgi:hypothetical protein
MIDFPIAVFPIPTQVLYVLPRESNLTQNAIVYGLLPDGNPVVDATVMPSVVPLNRYADSGCLNLSVVSVAPDTTPSLS